MTNNVYIIKVNLIYYLLIISKKNVKLVKVVNDFDVIMFKVIKQVYYVYNDFHYIDVVKSVLGHFRVVYDCLKPINVIFVVGDFMATYLKVFMIVKHV